MDMPLKIAAEKDANAADAFVERISATLDQAALVVMLSIGHRTGLLDTMAQLPAATSVQIAGAAGLAERYVREWLAALVTGGVVIYDPATATYRLPADHAACLTRDAPLGNLAVFCQHIAMMGKVEDKVLEVFRSGNGIEYADYPCFHAIMAEDSAQTVVVTIVETIESFDASLIERLRNGIDVLDAGCGSGLALIELARTFPASRFSGYDLCADAVDTARASAAAQNLSNVQFDRFDLNWLDAERAFDLITSFDAVHDTANPQSLLHAFYRALRPAGVHLMQDIGGSAHLERNLDFPFATLLYAISCTHCTPVSLAQGGEGLGTMWGWETAERMLQSAGFSSVDRYSLPHDPMNVWFVSRKAH